MQKKISRNDPDSILSSSAFSDTRTNRMAVNLNYTVDFENSGRLAIDADYQYYKMNQKERYYSYWEENVLNNGYYQIIPQNNDLWMGQVEYSTPLGDKNKLTVGSNAYSSVSENENEYAELQKLSPDFYPDSRFDYKEKGVTGYLSFQRQWSGKLSTSISSRFEYTSTEGDLKYPDPDIFSKDYRKLLPSVHVTYSPTDKLYLWYSLSARNTFPMYEYLNPFRNYQTTTSYSTGNPELRPSLTYYQELGSYLNSRYMFVLAHYIIDDAAETFTYTEGDNIEVTMPVNYGKETGIRLSINVNQPLYKDRWFLNTTGTVQYAHYKSNFRNLEGRKGHCIREEYKLPILFLIPENDFTYFDGTVMIFNKDELG